MKIIRDPVHGFVELTEWEWDIINHPYFQRLRRIKQLSGTDYLYPGATHTRFEHSLGVMQVATKIYDTLTKKEERKLKTDLNFDDNGLGRDRMLLRLASLLHDIGHSPFSHSGEDIMPINSNLEVRYKHEDYSEAVIKAFFKDLIDDHPVNKNYHLTANEVADFIQGKEGAKQSLFWRELLSGNIDADRCDYLLRDSLHAGVSYGKFDLERLIHTLTIERDPSTDTMKIAIEEGGTHAAEGLIIARYMMFTQVYFHKTRRAFDHHIAGAIKTIMGKNTENGDEINFPTPDSDENLNEYLKWDDWKVFGSISQGEAGNHGEILRERNHDRCVVETPENPDLEALNKFEDQLDSIREHVSFIDSAKKSWYKDDIDLNIVPETKSNLKEIKPLSNLSAVVKGLKSVNCRRIYVPVEQKNKALALLER